jgi:hypothetical protein
MLVELSPELALSGGCFSAAPGVDHAAPVPLCARQIPALENQSRPAFPSCPGAARYSLRTIALVVREHLCLSGISRLARLSMPTPTLLGLYAGGSGQTLASMHVHGRM